MKHSVLCSVQCIFTKHLEEEDMIFVCHVHIAIIARVLGAHWALVKVAEPIVASALRDTPAPTST